ncbi:MAG: hypothetical protein AAFX85_08915 [Pseudomonadota bacterium]
MSFFGKVVDFVSGGVGSKIVDSVASRFPAKMSEREREEMKLVIAQATREYEMELVRIAQQEQDAFNARIRDLEGTASDLRQAGWPGRVVLFFRGLQRPTWGFAVLILDFMVFSGTWTLPGAGNEQGAMDLESAFWVINFLVLGFLFGERAIQNVMPFFNARMGVSQAGDDSRTGDKAVG